MTTKYVNEFGSGRTAEGDIDVAEAVDTAAKNGSAKPAIKEKAAYEAAFMVTGGHAMTAVEIIKKD